MRNPAYNIEQVVYHVISAEKGIIQEIRYYFRMNTYQYLVTYGYGESDWCDEMELTLDKPIL